MDFRQFLRQSFPGCVIDVDDGDVDQLIDILLDQEARDQDPYYEQDLKISQLVEVFHDVNINLIRDIVRRFPDDSIESLMDAILAFKDQPDVNIIKRKTKYVPFNIPDTIPLAPKSFADAAVGCNGTKAANIFTFDFGPSYDGDIRDINTLRDILADIHAERKSFFHRAAEAFRQGGLTGQQAAAYYSQKVLSTGGWF